MAAESAVAPIGIFVVLAGLACLAGIFLLMIWSLVWVYRDANERGKQGWLVALLCFLFNWPISLLMWLVFRPEFDRLPMGKPLKQL